MKRFIAVLALALSCPAPAMAQRTFLASVEGVRLGPKEYVEAFSIATWGVEIIATCRIPPGWTINAGSSADPTGIIAGEASLGVTYLDRARLNHLRQIVLLRTNGPIRRQPARRGELPATFDGTAEIGTYGPSERTRKQKLDFRNVRLSLASRCPRPLR